VRVPQQARSRRTRKRIVEAAMLAFEEGGYDETTTAVIAKRAGIAVGTLYGYFENKRDILLEVVDHTLGEVSDLVVEQLDPATWRGRDPRDVVRTLIDTLFHIQTIRPGTQRVIYERYFKDDAFRELVEARQEPVRDAIVRFLGSVGPEHRPRALEPEAAALAIYNAVQWNATQAIMRFSEEPAAIDAAAREAADMIERYVFE
jgi:AcrR family transcriptional regulator